MFIHAKSQESSFRIENNDYEITIEIESDDSFITSEYQVVSMFPTEDGFGLFNHSKDSVETLLNRKRSTGNEFLEKDYIDKESAKLISFSNLDFGIYKLNVLSTKGEVLKKVHLSKLPKNKKKLG